MLTKTRATIEDLYHAEGKAELINGEIVIMPPTGDDPSLASGDIYSDLKNYVRQNVRGRVHGDGVFYTVNLPHRKSFAPDASFFSGARARMKFINGAPDFAVEVRSENDYGPAAEEKMAAKRDDYFAAGTLVVWDVDLLNPDVVAKYTADNPNVPQIFRRGDIADAEPAVPGWTMAVDDIFRDIEDRW